MIDLPSIARNIQWSTEGFWVCPSPSGEISYPAEGNRTCFAVEDGSFWFQHRNACILQAVSLFPPRCPLFDIGGGNGFVAKALQDAGFEVVLVEPGPEGVRIARRRGVRQVIYGSFEGPDFLPGGIPSAGLFDVLEHIEDDRAFLKRIHSGLEQAGRLYLTVPAIQGLWSNEDVYAGHYRRYDAGDLRALLESTGFAVEFASTFFKFLSLPILLFRTLPSRLGIGRPGAGSGRQHGMAVPAMNRPLRWLTERELSRIRASRRTHGGSSCLVVAKKG